MSSQYLDLIRKNVRATLDHFTAQREVWGAAIETFRQFDGCMVNKAFATKLAKKFPGCSVHYEKGTTFSSAIISIWGQGTGLEYTQRECFYLPGAAPFQWADFNALYTERKNKSVAYAKELTSKLPALPELIGKLQAARAMADAAEASMGALRYFLKDAGL